MSKIDIQRKHDLGIVQAREKIGGLEEQLKQRFGVKLAWRGNEAEVKGTGVTGTLRVTDTDVALNLKLGLMLRPVAGKIRAGIERGVDEALG